MGLTHIFPMCKWHLSVGLPVGIISITHPKARCLQLTTIRGGQASLAIMEAIERNRNVLLISVINVC